MAKITFLFEDKNIPIKTIVAENGKSLLEIALENDIHLNHNCGGVCACSTCHVYVEKGMELLPELSDREEDYIDRAINPEITSRLACQSIVSEGELEVVIPDQSQIIGHEH